MVQAAHDERTAVLIAGGGPVGLALAVELGLHGVPCTLVEQRDGSVKLPKMNNVSTRTMEFCRRWGVAAEVKKAGLPEDFSLDIRFVTCVTGHELLRFPFPTYAQRGELDYTPEGNRACSQLWFDPILLERARSLPSVTLRHRARLDGFHCGSDGIRAELMDVSSHRIETLTASYLIGCDGSESDVRASAGIKTCDHPRLNANLNIFFRCPKLIEASGNRAAQAYRLVGPQGIWANMMAINGRELWRVTIYLPRDTDLASQSFDAAELVRKAIGSEVDFEILGVLSWLRRRMVADHYRSGRVFIAGDSAHVMSTTGALGMNTGIGDAVNLAWKLAAVHQGWAGADLLDSYEAERRPIATDSVDQATKNFLQQATIPGSEDITSDNSEGAHARARFAAALVANGAIEQYEMEGLALGYRYDSSPIVWPERAAAPPDGITTYTQTARPGGRAPHGRLDDGRSTLDLFGPRFVLLCFSAAGAEGLIGAAAQHGVPVAVSFITNPAIAELYGARFVLVRPDGHVAWRSDTEPDDPGAVINRIRGERTSRSVESPLC